MLEFYVDFEAGYVYLFNNDMRIETHFLKVRKKSFNFIDSNCNHVLNAVRDFCQKFR